MADAAVAPACPWGFLAPLAPPQPCPAAISPRKTSFAQALSNSSDISSPPSPKRHACVIPLSQLPIPSLKEDAVAVQIPEEEYRAGLDSCKNNLHGRLLLPKGAAPLKHDELRTRLLKLWSSIGQWRMIPLGKGFYEFSFASIEDLRKIWSLGACNLEPGILRLFAWSPDFHPTLVRQTNTQANSCSYVADTSLDVSLATIEDYAHNEDPPPGPQQGEALIGDTISGFSMNTPVYVHDDLSFFPEAVQNDVKVLSALWANQKDASTSKEDEQNNHNIDTEGFKMVKFKKKYHLRMNTKPNSRFA